MKKMITLIVSLFMVLLNTSLLGAEEKLEEKGPGELLTLKSILISERTARGILTRDRTLEELCYYEAFKAEGGNYTPYINPIDFDSDRARSDAATGRPLHVAPKQGFLSSLWSCLSTNEPLD
jgi:hypothetical protein